MKADQLEVLRAKIEADKVENERLKQEGERAKREEAAMKRAAKLQKAKQEEKAKREAEVTARPKGKTFSQENVFATAAEMSNTINEKLKWLEFSSTLGKVKGDADMWERITKFWQICADTGEIPQKTDFYLFLGIDASRASEWRQGKGCSKEMQEMMNKFDLMYNSVRDSLADRNLINQIAYIWQSKQWQGYKEPIAKYQVESLTPLAELPSIESVEAKYLNAIPPEMIE